MEISVFDLKDIFTESNIEDIYVGGYIDSGSGVRDNIRPISDFSQFHPMWDICYLDTGKHLIACGTADNYSRISIQIVERIAHCFELDPDDTFGVMSVLRSLLPSGRDSARVLQIDSFLHEEDKSGRAISSLGLALDKGEYLFFDPMNFDGMHVGGAQSRGMWERGFGGKYRLVVIPVITAGGASCP
ncbi:hypothetical protein [Sorangium sp. So ce204]|uniref:hypothetical protein n=1 Tax=Sorangium sp. So ce204 TaxID=3133288 RepID=UPI003F60BE98